jgi:hypothetical protein
VLIDIGGVEPISHGPLFRCSVDIAPDAQPGAYRLVPTIDAAGRGATAVNVSGSSGQIVVREICGSCGCPDGSPPDFPEPIVFDLEGEFESVSGDASWVAKLHASTDTGSVSGRISFDREIDGHDMANVAGTFTGPFISVATPVGEGLDLYLEGVMREIESTGYYALAPNRQGLWQGAFVLRAPLPRVAPVIVDGLSHGVPQYTFVDFVADDIWDATRYLPVIEGRLERARLFAERKSPVWQSLAGAGIEILRDYSDLSSTFVQITDLDALRALLARPEVRYVGALLCPLSQKRSYLSATTPTVSTAPRTATAMGV